MPAWTELTRTIILAFLGRLILIRTFGCLLWLLILFLLLLAIAPLVRAEEPEWHIVSAIPLAPAVEGRPGERPRGVVLSTVRSFQVPEPPRGAELWISMSDQRLEPLFVDDLLDLECLGRDGSRFVLRHDFRNSTHDGIEPYGPVNVTAVFPTGQVTCTTIITDVQPPLYGAGPLFLLVRAPASPTPRPQAAVASTPATAIPAAQQVAVTGATPPVSPTAGGAPPPGPGSAAGGSEIDLGFWGPIAGAAMGILYAGGRAIGILTGVFWGAAQHWMDPTRR